MEPFEPIGWFESPFGEKFGTPRQSGVVPEIPGTVHFYPQFARPEALRGLEDFDWIWILWEFSLNRSRSASYADMATARPEETTPAGKASPAVKPANNRSLTTRPPRLGGNERIGVFASRSPYRPNPIGLSSVRIDSIDQERCTIKVLGADLVDGTPILDIKPYIAYSDSHPEARGGFTDTAPWRSLRISNPALAAELVGPELATSLLQALQNDPRPHYQRDNTRVYGLKFDDKDIHFIINGDLLTIVQDEKAN